MAISPISNLPVSIKHLTVRTEDGTVWLGRPQCRSVKDSMRMSKFVRDQQGKRLFRCESTRTRQIHRDPEHAASAGLIFFHDVGLRCPQADEGRRFLTKKGGVGRNWRTRFRSTRQYSFRPLGCRCSVMPWDVTGCSRKNAGHRKRAKLVDLQYSRYGPSKGQRVQRPARQSDPWPAAANRLGSGQDHREGILVTRTWYIRMVDPQPYCWTG